jgi:hypothetical protein
MRPDIVHYPNRKTRFTMSIIRGLPEHAYNSPVLPMGDGRFMGACRDQGEGLWTYFLDHRYQLIGKPTPIPLHLNIDPRLTWWRGRIWMTTRYYGEWDYWRQECWLLKPDGTLELEGPEILRRFCWMTVEDWPSYTRRREANWAPFVHEDQLHYVHTFNPHRVLRVKESGAVGLVSQEKFKPHDWKISGTSEYRLSTPPAQLPEGCYLSTVHKKREGDWHYWTGFYIFEGLPPWRVISMSPEPMLHPKDAIGPGMRHCPTLVFPVSLQVEGDLVRIGAGSNDSMSIVLHFSLRDVLASLKPV